MRLGIIVSGIIVSLCAASIATAAFADEQVAPAEPSATAFPSGKTLLANALFSDDPKQIAAIGMLLFDGIGVPIDHPSAMPLLEKAAALGRPEAQYRMGLAYSSGIGQKFYADPPADGQRAEQWMTKAAAAAAPLADTDPAAMMVLANLKSAGRGGVPKDQDGALSLIKRAAELGYPEAETAYGAWFAKDKRQPVNQQKMREAINWYLKAAIAGSSEAIEGMGIVYLALNEPEKARPLLRRAASMGRELASRTLYLNFQEKIGDNIASQQDAVFEAAEARQRQRHLIDRLSDPIVLGATVLAFAVIVGLATRNTGDPKVIQELNNEIQQQAEVQRRNFEILMCHESASSRGLPYDYCF